MTDTAMGLLREAKERIEQEDYIGTCGCNQRNRKTVDSEEWRRKHCPCYIEHIELIDRITAMLDSGKSAEAIVKNEALELAARECEARPVFTARPKRDESESYLKMLDDEERSGFRLAKGVCAAAIRKLKVE